MFPDVTTGTQKAVAGVGFAALVVGVLAVGLVLREHGPGTRPVTSVTMRSSPGRWRSWACSRCR